MEKRVKKKLQNALHALLSLAKFPLFIAVEHNLTGPKKALKVSAGCGLFLCVDDDMQNFYYSKKKEERSRRFTIYLHRWTLCMTLLFYPFVEQYFAKCIMINKKTNFSVQYFTMHIWICFIHHHHHHGSFGLLFTAVYSLGIITKC